MVHVVHLKKFAVVINRELARAENLPIMSAQHRDQNLVLQFHLRRVPVNVKPCCEPARRPVLQHVPPVSVFRARGHVVRHNVEHLPHAELF
jgi:hypothetical protein